MYSTNEWRFLAEFVSGLLYINSKVDDAQVRKRRFLSRLYTNAIILPRQARDKHRENSKKGRFLAGCTPRIQAPRY
jgi:hypothetical protein